MIQQVRSPIRRKILFTMLLAITAVAATIVFIMANLFHTDKQAYVKDWISIAALNTADDSELLLSGYRKRLEFFAKLAFEDISEASRSRLLEQMFGELPELVYIRVERDGEVLEEAIEGRTIEDSGWSEEQFRERVAADPLPIERILDGEVYLANAAFSSELPLFVLAAPVELGPELAPVVVSALFRSEALLRLGSQFPTFEVVIASADGTLLAHPDVSRVVDRRKADLPAAAMAVRDQNQAGMTLGFEQNQTAMLGGYAAIETGDAIVGVQIPASTAYLASRALLNRLLLVAFGLLLIAALFALTWAHRITRPVERLSRATREIARGDFNIVVDVDSQDEIGALAGSFNHMTSELRTREQALEAANLQLIQSEKLAAFGQLGAGIAHEVKNPLTGILACAQLAADELPPESSAFADLKMIEKEAGRCKTIIESLLKFARQEKAEMDATNVNEVIADSLAIVHHQLELNEVHPTLHLQPDLPEVLGNANQLQQVFINLLINAGQAIEGTGNIDVRSGLDGDGNVRLEFADDGPGIPEDIRAKIFEPFFTTKPTGEGTGLGLSVSYGIIQDHRGEISIESEPGRGTTFVICLPTLAADSDAPDIAVAAHVDPTLGGQPVRAG